MNAFEAFASKYQKEEKEILVLTSDNNGGATYCLGAWDTSQPFLAYIDISSNELKNGDGRIHWLVSEEDKKFGLKYPHYFKNGTVYRLKVRELIDKTVPEGRLPSAYNRFMVVEVLEADVNNDGLYAILTDYRQPAKIVDDTFGEFAFDRRLGNFEGVVELQGRKIRVYLSTESDIEFLHILCNKSSNFAEKASHFAATKLLELGNQWQEDDWEEETDFIPLTEEDFIKRISLNAITFFQDEEGACEYCLWFNDGDIFLGHSINVSGNKKNGFTNANIEG
ncbi:MAG: DUF2262 domain-containing protein [Defluviitaleaceae bacterium]|nr:DUF2262 domain-containing protein [Defluviitaleaceae bacterium]